LRKKKNLKVLLLQQFYFTKEVGNYEAEIDDMAGNQT
jgi:hypothetical protein